MIEPSAMRPLVLNHFRLIRGERDVADPGSEVNNRTASRVPCVLGAKRRGSAWIELRNDYLLQRPVFGRRDGVVDGLELGAAGEQQDKKQTHNGLHSKVYPQPTGNLSSSLTPCGALHPGLHDGVSYS